MTMLAAKYTDEDIRAISQQMVAAEQEQLFQTVSCCIVGAQCEDLRIVQVAIHPGFEDAPRNVDLYVDRYISHEPKKFRGSRPLGQNAVCIRRFPPGGSREQRYHWSIFFEDQYKKRDTVLPRNRLFDTFKGWDGRHSHFGNIMVVKSNSTGTVEDILERDLYFIEVLVYGYLEEHARQTKFSVLNNPLLNRWKKRRSSWDIEPISTWGSSWNI